MGYDRLSLSHDTRSAKCYTWKWVCLANGAMGAGADSLTVCCSGLWGLGGKSGGRGSTSSFIKESENNFEKNYRFKRVGCLEFEG